jgi:CRISPR-associated protein Cas1
LCESELIAGGLDPGLGFYHQTSYGRPSLACDLTELFRAMGDRFVLSLVKRGDIRTDHFTQKGDGCLMGKTGRDHYYTALAAEIPAWRKLIRRTVMRWISILPATTRQPQESEDAALSDLL